MRKFYSLLLCNLVGLLSLPLLCAQTMSPQNMETKKTSKITVGATPIVFYDDGGAEASASASIWAKTTFEPEDAQNTIQIEVKNVDLGNRDYFCVANGDPSFGSWSSTVYSGALFEHKTAGKPDGLPKTFVSTEDKGRLSVCFKTLSSPGAGFEVVVSAVRKPDMRVSLAELSRKDAYDVNPGQFNAVLGTLQVKAENPSNPLKLTSIVFDLKNTDPANISKIYVHKAKNKFSNTTPEKLLGKVEVINNKSVEVTLTEAITLDPKNDLFLVFMADVKEPIKAGNDTWDIVPATLKFEGDKSHSITDTENKSYKILPGVLIAKGSKEVTVDTDINFYDDGGIGGKVSEKFEGSITFVPKDAAKKVSIDFTKLNLFKRSSVGYSETLYIYNGKEAKEENLIVTLNAEKQFLVRSTHETGALTVVMKCDTGVPSQGFEAVVKQFTPQAMVFKGIEVNAPSNLKVNAGKEAVALEFTLKTENTAPALALKNLKFSVGESYTLVKKAAVYGSGLINDFSKAKKMGEVAITAQEMEVKLTNTTLLDGVNYFFLVYEIDNKAEIGQNIDAVLLSATVGDKTSNVENGNPEAVLTVENTLVLTKGTHTLDLYTPWNFIPEPTGVSGNHASDRGERIVTFRAPSPGHVIDLNFDLLEFYRSSYSPTKVTFVVYDGKDKTAKELLRRDSKNNVAELKTTPTKSIRSTGEYMTVYFDAGGEFTTLKGWRAMVKEYLPREMKAVSVTASHAAPDFVSVDAKKVPMLKAALLMDGTQNTLAVKGIGVDLKTAAKYINKLYLSSFDGENVASAKEIASVEVKAEDKEAAFEASSLAGIILEEGLNHFLLSVDVRSDAPAGEGLDIALKSFTVGDVAVKLVTPDPEGSCDVKIIYTQPKSKTDNQVTVNAPIAFYDDGGASDKISKSIESAVTFAPAKEGEVVLVTIHEIEVPTNCTLSLISGADYQGKNVLFTQDDAVRLKASKVYDYASTSADGKLTVYFKSTSITRQTPGWYMTVKSVKPRSRFVEKVVTQAPTIEKGIRPGASAPVLQITNYVQGEKESVKFQELGIQVSPSVAKVGLYATGVYDEFRDTQLLQTATPSEAGEVTFELNETVQLSHPVSFWVVVEAKTEAQAGSPITAKLTAVKANGTAISLAADLAQAATQVKVGGLKGEYVVGAGGAYADLATAATALSKEGLAGPVTLFVQPGEYKGVVWFKNIPGASKNNTLTIKGATGKPADVVISATGYSRPLGGRYTGLLNIEHTPYVTVRDLKVTSSDKTFPYLVYVNGASSNFLMDNCIVEAPFADGTPTLQNAPKLIEFAGDREDGDDHKADPQVGPNNVVVRNTQLLGGYTGVTVGYPSSLSLPVVSGAKIEGCRFEDQGSKGIYAVRMDNLTIANNTIKATKAPKSDYKGMDLSFANEGQVVNNVIHIAIPTPKTYEGIYIRESKGDKGVLLANNSITIEKANASSYGFDLIAGNFGGLNNNLRMLHNTVLMENNGYAVGLDLLQNAVVANNIFVTKSTSATVFFLKKNLTEGNNSFKNNAIYTANADKKVVKLSGADYTIETWGDVLKDTGSKFVNVEFSANEILYPKNMADLPKATFFAEVANDVLGAVRNAEAPTVGAYEADPNVTDKAPVLSGAKATATHNTATVTVQGDQMTTLLLLAVAPQENGAYTQPSAEEIKKNGTRKVILGKKDAEVIIENLKPETVYKVYALATGTLNAVEGEVVELTSVTTSFAPSQVATFEPKETREEQGVIFGGTNSFHGFRIIKDFESANNHIAEMVGSEATIKVTNSKTQIPQIGFSIKADRAVKLYKDSEAKPFVVLPATRTWTYVDLSLYGNMSTLKMESVGRLWIDNYNGEPMFLSIVPEDYAIDLGQEVAVEAQPYHGVAPYTYLWSNGATEAKNVVSPVKSTEYTVTVTDAKGQKVTATYYVAVNDLDGNYIPATFDELPLPEGVAYAEKKTFIDGAFVFPNNFTAQYDSWSGCAYAGSASKEFDPAQFRSQQFNVVPGGGKNSKQYGVFYCPGDYPAYNMSDPVVRVVNKGQEGRQLTGVYVTTTSWLKYHVLNGTAMGNNPAKPFGNGDYFKVVIAADNGKTIEYYLVDYRNNKKFIEEEWKWIDLSSLGSVNSLKFSVASSDSMAPSYVAVDGLGIDPNASTTPQKKLALSLVKKSAQEVEVQWRKLSRYVSYTAQIVRKDAVMRTMKSEPIMAPAPETTVSEGVVTTTFSGLEAATDYVVIVKAFVEGSAQPIITETLEVKTENLSANLDLTLKNNGVHDREFEVSFNHLKEADRYTLRLRGFYKVDESLAFKVGEPVKILDGARFVVTEDNGVYSVAVRNLEKGATYILDVIAQSGSKQLAAEQVVVTTTGGLGVDEAEAQEAKVVLTSDEVKVWNADGATVEVYDFAARVVARYQVSGAQWSAEHHLASGNYVVLLYRAGQSVAQTFKAVVQ